MKAVASLVAVRLLPVAARAADDAPRRLSLLHRSGVEVERHGDSTGVLKEVIA